MRVDASNKAYKCVLVRLKRDVGLWQVDGEANNWLIKAWSNVSDLFVRFTTSTNCWGWVSLFIFLPMDLGDPDCSIGGRYTGV